MAYVAYGGTFDPIHCGHVAVAQAVRDRLGTPVHLVPAADPPHKDATHADAGHRLRMVELAIAGERGLRVDPRELERSAPSYTVDTLDALRHALGPDVPLVWVVGADSLSQLHRWHRWHRLFLLGHVLAVGRPGFPLDADGLAAVDEGLAADVLPRITLPEALLDRPAGGLALLPMEPPRAESSTRIRRLMAEGGNWRGDVPPSVAAYIDRHRLYARGDAA